MPRGSDKPLDFELDFNAEAEPLEKKRGVLLSQHSFGRLPEVVGVSNKDGLAL